MITSRPAGGSRRVYQTAGTPLSAIASVVGAAAFVAVGISNHHVLVYAVAAALLTILGWRIWRSGINVGTDDVRVVMMFVTRTVQWQEIDKFYVDTFISNSQFAAYVLLRDGRKLCSAGLSTVLPNIDDKYPRAVQRPVDELNALLDQWRRAHLGATEAV